MTETPQPTQNGTGTDGVVTGFVEGGGSDGLDESGDPVFQGCLYASDPSGEATGFVHQCAAEYNLDFVFDFQPLIGDSASHPFGTTAHTLNDSTYEHPFAAVCCSDIEEFPGWSPNADTCAIEAHRACYSDLVQHLCGAPPVWIADTAKSFGFNGPKALDEAATWFKNNRDACYDHFWTGTDALSDANYCGAAFDVFYNHPAWEPKKTFTYHEPITGADAVATNFSLSASTLFDTVGVQPLPADPTACSGPVDNNGEVPPHAAPGSGSILTTPFAPVPIDVNGPKWMDEIISGSAELGGDSWLAYEEVGTDLSIEGWTMLEEQPATVGTSSVSATVTAFRMDLVEGVLASGSGTRFSLAVGEGIFHLAASVDGVSDYVIATNSTAVDFWTVSGGVGDCPSVVSTCLIQGDFTIAYTDAFNEDWELDVDSGTWVP